MGKTAFLFAGQGSQYPGMTKDLFENIHEVHDFYGVAEAIRPGTLSQLFSGSEEELKKTENTQPCLFLADMAGAIALKSSGIMPDAVAGFSLGEIAGLCAAGVLSGAEAFKLVCKRGQLMQNAADKIDGSMIAVMRMDKSELQDLCTEYGVYPVNYNCPGQIVVSGKKDRIESLGNRLTELKVRFMKLAVGGPFHTPYMEKAAGELKKELETVRKYNIYETNIPLYANRNAEPYPSDEKEVIETISSQICNSVRWEETLLNMHRDGIDTFIECGPGKTLSGFVKRTLPTARIYNVSGMESLQEVIKEF